MVRLPAATISQLATNVDATLGHDPSHRNAAGWFAFSGRLPPIRAGG
jgi:hypothetical protein